MELIRLSLFLSSFSFFEYSFRLLQNTETEVFPLGKRRARVSYHNFLGLQVLFISLILVGWFGPNFQSFYLLQRFRRRQSFPQNPMDDAKLQAQKTSLLQAQKAGATGNFKSFNSQFNNILIPVIPMQFLSKAKLSFNEVG